MRFPRVCGGSLLVERNQRTISTRGFYQCDEDFFFLSLAQEHEVCPKNHVKHRFLIVIGHLIE